MDAPTYPPATAFEQPLASPYVISLDNSSLAEVMEIPAAWDIVVKHLPSLQRMVGSPMIKPHLSNFSIHSLSVFSKTGTPETIAAINAELSRLPPVREPAL